MREVKRNSKGEKLYPFSMARLGHNIELAYNIISGICARIWRTASANGKTKHLITWMS